jgi:hypothetical protein
MTPRVFERLITPTWRPGRAAVAGLVATLVYSLVMYGDMRLTHQRFNDVRFLEGLLEGQPFPQKRVPLLAWGLHLLNGLLLAEVYAAICKRFLPGPDWVKGSFFGELFTLALWGTTPLIDNYHPMIQSGYLPRLARRSLLLQNLVRHLFFGLTLGLLYHDPPFSAKPSAEGTREQAPAASRW